MLFFIPNFVPPFLPFLIQAFLYCPPCGQMPACSCIMCMTQQQCWTTDLWIFADVRNVQNVPHCWLQCRKSRQHVAWWLLSFLLSCGWHIASSLKSEGRLSTTIVPSRPVRLAVGRKRRMWVSDMLSSALIIPGLRMVIATRCSVFAEQQRGLQNWEGSAKD